MKSFLAALAVLIGAAAFAPAQSLDETYVRIYSLIQQGDQLLAAGQAEAAVTKFTEADERLKQFKVENPAWNEKVVTFRLRYVAERLQQARKGEIPPASSPARPATVVRPAPAPESVVIPTTPAPTPATTEPSPATPDARQFTAPLERQIRQLEAEKASLEAKLREALSAQPAAVDPRELAKAQEQIRILQKENEILKVSFAQEKERAARAVDPAMVEQIRSALADSNRKLAEQADAIVVLRTENSLLKTQMQSNPDLTRLRAENTTLTTENQSLKQEVGTLQQEIATLKPQLTAAAADLAKQMADARAQLNTQQKRIDELTLERTDLERRLRVVPVPVPAAPVTVAAKAPAPAPAPAANTTELEKRVGTLETELGESRKLMLAAAAQLQQLQQEKATLVSQVAEYALQAAMAKPAAANTKPTTTTTAAKPAPDLELLRARIASLEAKPVPYTAEERALFQVARAVKPADAPAGRVSTSVLPSGAATLVSQAQRAFNDRRLDEAERLYQQAIKLDTRNAYMLANLAATQLEQGRFPDAEANLQRALESAPDDAFALQLLGISKFRQNQFDDALNSLSRAAQLDPSNAETQNYLGVAFGQKGQRAPAETALRKAVQLSPGYASAHHNLAVVYATAQPPAVELARYHYGKARAAGHPQNADLEKILSAKAAAAPN
jgi:tetratricopeptide (TPR) repeat protein